MAMDDGGLQALEGAIRGQRNRYWGKYRAFVADADDPEGLGRVKLTVPSVLGEATSDWALPCVPYGGGEDFGFLAVPPVGAQVIAEFLEGDISSPVWTGAFWRRKSETPAEHCEGGGQSLKILKTESGHLLSFQDKAGEEAITLRTAAEAEILMDAEGSIQLTDKGGAKVTLDAEASEIRVEDASGNSLVMSSSGVTVKDASGNEITAAASGVTVKSSAVISIEGSMVSIAGSGGEPLIKGASFLALFNTHTHGTGVGPSTPPVVPLTPSVLTTKSTAQ